MAATKYVVIIPDGAADLPLTQLQGKTPFHAADTPNLDALAREGTVGLVHTIPQAAEIPGSDIAMLCILGYDPTQYFTGRAPLEAASMGIDLSPEDAAFRCNLVSSDGEILKDYSAGHISTEEARALIELADEKLGQGGRRFITGISYRHLMVWPGGPVEVIAVPPHDIQGDKIESHLPQGEGAEVLRDIIFDSFELFNNHEINKQRRAAGKPAANMLWPWGQGRAPQLPSFASKWGKRGTVIAAVDLVRGIAKYAGLEAPKVEGATGGIETDFAAKARAALEALESADFVFVHIEAPDEASHQGSASKKIHAIEEIDREIVGPLKERLQGRGKMLVLPDHYTPVSIRTHARMPVPFVIWPGDTHAEEFCETKAGNTGIEIKEGCRLLERFFAD